MTRAEWIQQALLARATMKESWEDAIQLAVDGADALEKAMAAPWDNALGKTYEQGLADGNAEGLTLGQKDSRRWIADALGAERETVARIAENSGLIDFAATLRGRTFIMAESADPLSAVKVELVKSAVRVEREACAKIAEDWLQTAPMAAESIAKRIRARGNP